MWSVKIQYSIFGCENLGVHCRAFHQPYHIFCGLSELWERKCTLDKHVRMLLVLIQEKKLTFQQSREYFIEETHRKTVQIKEMEGAIQDSFRWIKHASSVTFLINNDTKNVHSSSFIIMGQISTSSAKAISRKLCLLVLCPALACELVWAALTLLVSASAGQNFHWEIQSCGLAKCSLLTTFPLCPSLWPCL